MSTHVVDEGESLRSIAARYGVALETVAVANGMSDPDLLRVGQELVVPSVDGVLHTVLQGDTLKLIASRYGVELADLIAANDLGASPDQLAVGTVLVVPGARAMVAPPEPAPAAREEPAQEEPAAASQSTAADGLRAAEVSRPAPSAPQPSTYTVRDGDTLRGIAQAFGLDILTLVAMNGLTDPDLIRPGRTLRVSASGTLEHVVKPGETLADLAWHYSVPSAVLLDANGIANPDRIVTGMVLVVPGARPRSADVAPRAQAEPTPVPPTPVPQPAAPARRTAATATPVRRAPTPTPVRQPSAPAPAPASSSGERVITARITGYALGAGAVSTRTASGTQVHWGTVAADTRLYPFGTRLRIEGFPDTIFVVEDTGSAVRGNIFDIWFPDAASARRMGAQTRQVTILP